jgi:hypothetical protein
VCTPPISGLLEIGITNLRKSAIADLRGPSRRPLRGLLRMRATRNKTTHDAKD